MVLQTAGKPGRVAHRAWHAEGTVGIQERLGRLVRLDPHGSQGHVDDLRQLLPKSVVREIRTPRSVGTGGGRPPPVTRWMWKRSHGRTSEAPPDERGGYRYVRPTATASHLDSTQLSRRPIANRARGIAARVTLRRLDLAAEIYHIREPQKIPLVMSPDETRRLLAVASNLTVRTLLSLGYGCGLRASEVVRLKVKHIDSAQKVIRIEQS